MNNDKEEIIDSTISYLITLDQAETLCRYFGEDIDELEDYEICELLDKLIDNLEESEASKELDNLLQDFNK